ncbi:uncharacterized protein [Neodiprion pinetum]|uniref:uncharacterized protein n=1 Tax=Neodiprion pinetum TaxID=441929 RepID=UPI001EDD19AB|nr:uncharacterized protein LOC124216220 [Neodiprion pinetum]
MSQSGSNGSNGLNVGNDSSHRTGTGSLQGQTLGASQNGKSVKEHHHQSDQQPKKSNDAVDLSNGFENRTMEYERYAQERAQERTVNQISHAGMTYQNQAQTQSGVQYNTSGDGVQTMQPVQFPQTGRITGGQLDDRHPVPGQIPTQYGQDKIQSMQERVQYVSQAGTQIVPVQVQPQFTGQEYPGDQGQFSQIRSQFEVRSQAYPGQGQYSERAGYVTRDIAYRDQSVYSQPNSVPIFGGQGQYVTVQPQSSQSASPQPAYYSGVVIPSQTFAQISSQQQYPYGQYTQTVMNPGTVPYAAHPGNIVIGHPQQFGQQSPNPQGFSQDSGQYQNQPIIQPIAQNIAQGMQIVVTAERPTRGPKPTVPPRGNSKITHDSSGHRKSASVDVSSIQKPGNQAQHLQGVHKYDGTAGNLQDIHRGEIAGVTGAQSLPENPERRYLAPINQNPRTRQDGLYIDTNGDKIGIASEAAASESALYVSRPEHRKSASVDVTTSFQKRNDTITFTFPGDNQEILVPGRKMSNSELKRHEGGNAFSGVGIGPSFDPSSRQENRKSVIGVERKPDWGCALSPGQRSISHENRRSDYFEEHRRSPLTLDQKRMDEVRKSPMPFVPIRDLSVDRAGQKSPSFVNQAFEKTRQELAVWAEQRQRQELEKGVGAPIQPQMFSTSPRSRNQSEERKDPRIVHQVEERRELRMSQSAFQPIPNISQNTIMEQRRHLRHVSADLTKHMELSRKDFDEQPTASSMASLGAIVPGIGSQRTSPSLCQQYPAISEAKIDAKCALTIATDFGDGSVKSMEQVDHIIHSHRKSHNLGSTLLTHSKSQTESLQAQNEAQNDGSGSQFQQHIQMQNQQSLDQISEKLSQFERQQSDLQTKLQCLQNQSQILDKVSQFQHQQSDLQAKMQSLQSQAQPVDKLNQIQTGHQYHGNNNESQAANKSQSGNLQTSEQFSEKLSQLHRQQSEIQTHQNNLHNQLQQTLHQGFLPGGYKSAFQSQNQMAEKLSPRLQQHEDSDPNPIQIPSMSQMPLPNLSQFDRTEVGRSSLQYRFTQCDAIDVGSSAASFAIGSSASFTGTLKKVPPEKPPRTSLIVQSPEAESNRSQPAIGLKQTPKARPTIFGTVASDLNPKDGNSRRSLPQTPAGCTGAKGLSIGSTGSGNVGSVPGPGLANGANVEHPDPRDSAAINTEHALVYRDGNLVSGSLEALVQHMVPTEEYYPDRAYLFAFLLSARLFIKPHELLGEVCALCELQQNLTGEGGKERLHRFVPRLVQLLAEWTETFPYDFRDERVMSHVRAITQKVAAVDATARQEVSALLQNLLLRLTALERYEEGLAGLATEAAAEQLTQVDVTELCPSASVLAQQLTHVELERLSYIGPEEFVQAFAKESPHLETSFKDMKKTRNLESYVQWFNRLSYFVATEVCKHAKKKQRVRVVEYWIETARECFNIGNFNSLMAIIAGLNMSPISRLKKTWSKVQSAKFSILEHQMDPSSNFSSYRSTLKAAMWRSAGATDERQRIVVPFFSLLVKDLYFLNEGCSNKLPNGHINFEKFWQLAKQVTEFIAWKQVACPFEKNARVIAFLQASPVLTENSLALASFECEPPDNNPEKERYKSLKSELNAQ